MVAGEAGFGGGGVSVTVRGSENEIEVYTLYNLYSRAGKRKFMFGLHLGGEF